MDSSYDCIVIGAGYSGLAAAKTLKEAGKRILLIEARDRVGGRAHTVRDNEDYFDNGASYLGVHQDEMYALAREFGVATFKSPTEGRKLIFYRGKAISYKGLIPALKLWEIIDLGIVMRRFEKLAKNINLEEPWKTRGAENLDMMTLKEWYDRNCWTKAVNDIMTSASELIWGHHPSCISLLYGLWYTKAGVSLTVLSTTADGAQEQLVRGGGQLIANKIAEFLGNDILHLQEPVHLVRHFDDDNKIEITTSKGSYHARKVIFAIPPPLLLKVNFEPPLPIQKVHFLQRSPPGSYVKVFATFPTPFWRKYGFVGEVMSPDAFIALTNDVTPEKGSSGKLMGFIVGRKTYEFLQLDEKEQKELCLKEWGAVFGDQVRNEIKKFHVHSMMQEEWSLGCPLSVPAPGMFTTLGEWWRAPIGGIHWAGTETATKYCGYMEGAVVAGKRAATEVLEALKV